MRFIGRKAERALLEAQISGDGQCLVVVRGPRGIGKSAFVRRCLRDACQDVIWYVCEAATEKTNARCLARLADEKLNIGLSEADDMRSVLEALAAYASEHQLILVLDDYPALHDAAKNLDVVLQEFMAAHQERLSMKIILCGSRTGVMQSLNDRKSALHGCIDLDLELLPLTFREAVRFFPNASPVDAIRLYGAFGGFPSRLKHIDDSKSPAQNIIDAILAPGAPLAADIEVQFADELLRPVNANEILCALARGCFRYSDLRDNSCVSSVSVIADTLDRLLSSGLIERVCSVDDPDNRRRAGYRIADPFTLFAFRYLFGHASERVACAPEKFYRERVRKDFAARHVPEVFTQVCRQHLEYLRQTGYLSGDERIGAWCFEDPETHGFTVLDLVSFGPSGLVYYGTSFKKSSLSRKAMHKEMQRVLDSGCDVLNCGFFSRSGFSGPWDGQSLLVDLPELLPRN